MNWPTKDPIDILDYQFDISPALIGNDGDAIATLDVTIEPAQPGDLTLYPGHGPDTTLDEERRENPFVGAAASLR